MRLEVEVYGRGRKTDACKSRQTQPQQIGNHKNQYIMTQKKLLYEQPSCDLLVVRFEENFCGTGLPGNAGGSDPYAPGDEEDLS